MCVYDRLSLRDAVNRLLEAQGNLELHWVRNFPEAKEDVCGRHYGTDIDILAVRDSIWELLRSLGIEEDHPNADMRAGS